MRVWANGALPPGTVLGHEFVGRISAAGHAATGAGLGARVVVIPLAWCGRCAACQRDAQQLCAEMWPGSVGLGTRPGALAEFTAVDAGCCRPFPKGLQDAAGALVEPFAVGLHATRRSRLARQPGALTGIIGAGTIGLMVLAAIRLVDSAATVMIVEPNPVGAAVARRLGAAVVGPDADAATAALGTPVEVLFDCTGATEAITQAAPHLMPGGELILVGVLEPGQAYPLPGRHWVSQELECRGSSGYCAVDFDDALGAVAAGAVDLTPIIGGRYPLAEAERAFAELSRLGASARVLLKP